MTTRPHLRLAVAFLIVAASTLGARPDATALEAVPFELVPADVTTPAAGTAILTDDWALAEAITIEADHSAWLVRDAQNRADIAAHETELARLADVERYNAEQARLVALRPATSYVRAAPVTIAPGTIWAMIDDAARRHGIDPTRFARIAWCESGGDPNAYNPSGASGPFQQMPQFWAGRAAAAGFPGASIWDPWINVEVSAWLAATGGWSHWNESKHCWG